MHVYAGFYTFSGGYIDQPFLERDRSGFVKKTSPVWQEVDPGEPWVKHVHVAGGFKGLFFLVEVFWLPTKLGAMTSKIRHMCVFNSEMGWQKTATTTNYTPVT